MYKYFKCPPETFTFKMDMETGLATWGEGSEFKYYPSDYNNYVEDGTWIPCDKDGNTLTQDQLAFIKLIEESYKDIEQGNFKPISKIVDYFAERKEESMKKIDLSKVKVGDKLVAKKDGGMNGDMEDLFCEKGKSYSIVVADNSEKYIVFIDKNCNSHSWDDLSDDINEYFYLEPKKDNQPIKRKSENWTNTIVESKFNRCIEDCIVIQKDYHSTQGFDIYYNEKTNTIYRRLQCADGKVRCVSKHLNRCPHQEVVEIYDEMINNHKTLNYEVFVDCSLVNEKSSEGEITFNYDYKFIDETVSDWTDKHYNFIHRQPVTKGDSDVGYVEIKIDPYFVNEVWELNKKDSTGIVFHCLKTLARWCDKNTEEREIRAVYGQIKRLAEMRGIDL